MAWAWPVRAIRTPVIEVEVEGSSRDGDDPEMAAGLPQGDSSATTDLETEVQRLRRENHDLQNAIRASRASVSAAASMPATAEGRAEDSAATTAAAQRASKVSTELALLPSAPVTTDYTPGDGAQIHVSVLARTTVTLQVSEEMKEALSELIEERKRANELASRASWAQGSVMLAGAGRGSVMIPGAGRGQAGRGQSLTFGGFGAANAQALMPPAPLQQPVESFSDRRSSRVLGGLFGGRGGGGRGSVGGGGGGTLSASRASLSGSVAGRLRSSLIGLSSSAPPAVMARESDGADLTSRPQATGRQSVFSRLTKAAGRASLGGRRSTSASTPSGGTPSGPRGENESGLVASALAAAAHGGGGGGKRRRGQKQLLSVSIGFGDATLEQPIDGELQGLNSQDFLEGEGKLLRLVREGLARERRRVRRLQHRRGGPARRRVDKHLRRSSSRLTLADRMRQMPWVQLALLATFGIEAIVLLVNATSCLAVVSSGDRALHNVYDAVLNLALGLMMLWVVKRSAAKENAWGIALAVCVLLLLLSSNVNTALLQINHGITPRSCSAELVPTATNASIGRQVGAGGGSAGMTASSASSSGAGVLSGPAPEGVVRVPTSVLYLSLQGAIVLIITILAKWTHAEFGWRTFSHVAGYRISLRAYRSHQLLRACLEWSSLFTLVSLLAACLLHTEALQPYLPYDFALATLAFVLDFIWLILAWFTVSTATPSRFLLGFRTRVRRGHVTHRLAGGYVRFGLYCLLGLAHPVWLIFVDVRLVSPADTTPEIFQFDNAVSTAVLVLMRLATLVSAFAVWWCGPELRRYYTQRATRLRVVEEETGGEASGGGEHEHERKLKLPAHVKAFVKSARDERALRTCRLGTRIAIVREIRDVAKERECFLQLSECFTSIRWSWTDYLLIDELVDVRTSSDKPLHFVVLYSQVSSLADRTLTVVCKSHSDAEQWVRSLRLLRQAYARGWGVPTAELARLKAAFKVASNGKESLHLNQQQFFFAALNHTLPREQVAKLDAELPHHKHGDSDDDEEEDEEEEPAEEPAEEGADGLRSKAAEADVERGEGRSERESRTVAGILRHATRAATRAVKKKEKKKKGKNVGGGGEGSGGEDSGGEGGADGEVGGAPHQLDLAYGLDITAKRGGWHWILQM